MEGVEKDSSRLDEHAKSPLIKYLGKLNDASHHLSTVSVHVSLQRGKHHDWRNVSTALLPM